MSYHAGIDGGWEYAPGCVGEGEGRVGHEGRAARAPAALVEHLGRRGVALARVGREAGPRAQWLFDGWAVARLPVVLIETRHFTAAQAALRVRTDRGDARAIAQIMRGGWFRSVPVQSPGARPARAPLPARPELVAKARDLENRIRGLLRGCGLKGGRVGRGGVAARVRALLDGAALLAPVIAPLRRARAVRREQGAALHKKVLRLARADAVCRQLMTAPGGGAVVALTFTTALDDPPRFARSRTVGAHLGPTPRRYQSGAVDRPGRISKVGDPMVRPVLFEAATVLLSRVTRWSALKAWAMRVQKRGGLKKARVARARKRAVGLHRMWRDGSAFCWQPQLGAAAGDTGAAERAGRGGPAVGTRSGARRHCRAHPARRRAAGVVKMNPLPPSERIVAAAADFPPAPTPDTSLHPTPGPHPEGLDTHGPITEARQ